MAGAFKRFGRRRDTLVLGDELCGDVRRIERRVGEQLLGERGEAGFARNGRFGAPLGLEGGVEIFERDLGFGRHDLLFERGRKLSLFADRLQDRVAPGVQVGQIGQARREVAQLGVIEAAGAFFPVARDERHRGALPDQLDRRRDLFFLDIQFAGNNAGDRNGSG